MKMVEVLSLMHRQQLKGRTRHGRKLKLPGACLLLLALLSGPAPSLLAQEEEPLNTPINVTTDPEIVLEKALATLQRWEKSAEPLIVELQKRAQEKSDLELIAEAADGDARRALNLLEIASDLSEDGRIGHETVKGIVAGRVRRFDKGGESFYDQISALHKSVRGSSPDAALYWLCRMLDGGCDPLYVARRVVRMASEDIGNADPRALQIALNAWDVQERLGSPEGELAIAQAIVYMAVAAKSNAVYTGFKAAMRDARESGSLDVPLHLRNAPTKLMKELDYGKAYRYAHDEPDAYAAGEIYFPEELGEPRRGVRGARRRRVRGCARGPPGPARRLRRLLLLREPRNERRQDVSARQPPAAAELEPHGGGAARCHGAARRAALP